MTYKITIRTAAGQRIYIARGTLAELQDDAYDAGALGVTAIAQP